MRKALCLGLTVTAFAGCAAPAPDASKPGAKAGATTVALVNPGFESAKPGMLGNPEGWLSIQHAGRVLHVQRSIRVRRGGNASMRIDNVGPEPFGLVYQKISAAPLRGKTVRLSAWIRTREVAGSATGGGGVLTLQAMRSGIADRLRAHGRGADEGHGRLDAPRDHAGDSRRRGRDRAGRDAAGAGHLWLDDVELDVEPIS